MLYINDYLLEIERQYPGVSIEIEYETIRKIYKSLKEEQRQPYINLAKKEKNKQIC